MSRTTRGEGRHDRRVRWAALFALLAMVAVACGGRLDEGQIQAELAEDSPAAGLVGGGVAAPGGSAADGITGVGGDSAAVGRTGAGANAGSNPGSDAGTATGPAGAGSETAPPAPEDGNGGATDVGVTATQIDIGNVATLSGPVPGLFAGALKGTQAGFAYQNSLGGLFGREFRVRSGDDGFDAGKNRSAHKNLADEVFAFSGSFSLFDGSGVSEMEAQGVLDIGRALSPRRQDMDTHISIVPFGIGWPTTGCDYLKDRFGTEAIKKMALFWGNQEAARNNAEWQRTTCESRGFEFIYEREFQATESNFTADVAEMRRLGVQGFFIVFDVTGVARFFKSLHQQNFDPPIKYPTPAAYDSEFIKLAGADAVEGAIIGQNMSMFLGDDADMVPEINLFREWLARIDPNQKVDLFALYGWASSRLLVHAMKEVGPRVTRTAVLDVLKGIHSWNNFGLTETMDIGRKVPGKCEMYMEIRDGQFHRVFPDRGFHCQGEFFYYPG